MAIEDVRKLFKEKNLENRIIEFEESSATVEMAAEQIGCISSQIAKTLTFKDKEDGSILIVANGSSKIDNRKFKDEFGFKAKMIKREDVERLIGHKVGGVCPFAVNEKCSVYLDNSLKVHEIIYPAAGSTNSVAKLNIEELQNMSNYIRWVDVTI